MKQVLNKEQVNSNLADLPHIKCYDIAYINNKPYYKLSSGENGLIVAFGKQVFWHRKTGCDNEEKGAASLIFEGLTYLAVTKRKQVERMLLICGLKESRKTAQIKPEQRLKQLDSGLHEIYKMMRGLEDISGELYEKPKINRWNRYETGVKILCLRVTHSKGSFSIPFENIVNNPQDNEEIQNIFFNALNMPVTSKVKTA